MASTRKSPEDCRRASIACWFSVVVLKAFSDGCQTFLSYLFSYFIILTVKLNSFLLIYMNENNWFHTGNLIPKNSTFTQTITTVLVKWKGFTNRCNLGVINPHICRKYPLPHRHKH